MNALATCHPDPNYTVKETDHLWITMRDGVRLAARLWRPETGKPVPALLEYIPYRKSDMVRARDERNHPFFAANGYACIRVDMRGSGDSEGHMPDMYAPAELDDARQVIEWLADQSWCDGNVGMFGTSWGGTASLQASLNAPKPLKAVIAVCATHDRYEDDIHYMGGCVLSDTFEWGATLPAILASPPTPNVGSDWMHRWRTRIETLDFPLETWLREMARGSYWRHGSIVHQAEDLSIPILSIGGWSDRYSNSVMALVDARPDIVWGILGPWGHQYPDLGLPGPGIGFQRVALEWWDHWLKSPGSSAGIWPRLRVWLKEFETPSDKLDVRKGTWVESGPPSRETNVQTLALADMACATSDWHVPHDPRVGLTSGDTGYFGRSGGLPLDQSSDDERSLVFETKPLDDDLVLYGSVILQLDVANANPTGQIAARLVDVPPAGAAARITYGVRNLALNDALDHPDPMPDTDHFRIRLRMHSTAYLVKKGHRLRLSVSASLWPMITMSAGSNAIALRSGTASLPVFKGKPPALRHRFPTVEKLPVKPKHETLSSPALTRWHSSTEGFEELGWHQPPTSTAYAETATTFEYETSMTHRLQSEDETRYTVNVDHRLTYERPDGVGSTRVVLCAETDDAVRHVVARLTATWNGTEIGRRSWDLKL